MKLIISILLLLTAVLQTQLHTEAKHIDEKYLLGKVKPSSDSNFVRVSQEYTSKPTLYLEKETYAAYLSMQTEAAKEGISLPVLSGFRSFYHQSLIWEAKWTGKRKVEGKNLKITAPDPLQRAKTILRYSSMPGTSRHHWGTDIDIYSLNNAAFDKGEGLKVYNWLTEHAGRFGFCQVYSKKGKDRPNGYEEEKWHWSYMPKSSLYLEAYLRQIDNSKISGFKGAETAAKAQVIEHYVQGIKPSCSR